MGTGWSLPVTNLAGAEPYMRFVAASHFSCRLRSTTPVAKAFSTILKLTFTLEVPKLEDVRYQIDTSKHPEPDANAVYGVKRSSSLIFITWVHS